MYAYRIATTMTDKQHISLLLLFKCYCCLLLGISFGLNATFVIANNAAEDENDMGLSIESFKTLTERELDKMFTFNELGYLIKFRDQLIIWRKDLQTYYSVTGKYPTGRLYNTYKATVSKLRKANLFPREKKRKKGNVTELEVQNCSENIVLFEPSQEQEWLKYYHTEAWETVEPKWLSTSEVRMAQLTRSKEINIVELLEFWPAYKSVYGPLLIDHDFQYMYPAKGCFLLSKWDDFSIKIRKIFKTHIKDKLNLTKVDELSSISNKVPVYLSETVQGEIGYLPCNITPTNDGDRVTLVFWYKEGSGTPLYSVDTRGGHESPLHFADEKKLGDRANFQMKTTPAMLQIKNIRYSDNGIYRCRVDFHKQPTRNMRAKLKVIVPPEKLLILDSYDELVNTYILGPYNEGATINTTCISIGGRPLPNVTWWYENTLLDDVEVTILSDKRVKNVLKLRNLDRQHLHRSYTCQATNNNVTTPIVNAVTLELNLKPLTIKINRYDQPLSAGTNHTIMCEVAGSRPTPSITWWKGSTPMRSTREIYSADNNITTSLLDFKPTIDDRGKYLSCRAEQALIPDSGIEDGIKLDVYHKPVVTLEFGTNLNSTTIREGADVYFECNIKSNPFVYKISWRHNDKVLDNNVPEGIIITNQSLVLQNVSRVRSGLYTCIGTNREGDGTSNAVNLDIKHSPVCREGQKNIYSIGRHESSTISCAVESNPPYGVTFFWKINSSDTEFIDIPASLITMDLLNSSARYTPITDNDYGTLLCWGSNEIGMQKSPCVYNIIPSGKPDAPTNCTVFNQTYNGFQIECIEGYDGGQIQEFVIEIYAVGDRVNPTIRKQKKPYFEITNLNSGIEYNVFVMAQNKRGRSNSTYLLAYTLKNPEKQTDILFLSGGGGGGMSGGFGTINYGGGIGPTIENMKPFLAILIGCVGGTMLIAIIIVFIVRARGSSGHDRNNNCETTSYTVNGQRNCMMSSSQDIGTVRDLCAESMDNLDKNPDIIPQVAPKIDEKDEDDEKCFEWINAKHPNMYATAAVAEQNSLHSSITSYNSSYSHSGSVLAATINDKQQQQQQHHSILKQQHHSFIGTQPSNYQMPQYQQHHHTHSTFHNSNYHTMIPYNKYNTKNLDLRYPEFASLSSTPPVPPAPSLLASSAIAAPQCQRIQFVSSTLGRPRYNQLKSSHESSSICAQIDLAQPHATGMYSTNPMFANNGVTMVSSHLVPSTITTFPPPPLFANNPIPSSSSSSTTAAHPIPCTIPLGIATSNIGNTSSDSTTNTSSGLLLQTVPENSVVNNTVNSISNNGTRF